MTMMKRRNIIMVIMTSLLLGSCSSEDILSVPNGNGRIRFDVGVSQSQEVAVTPMNGGATRSAEPLFLPTSSIEMHSGDMKMYANCASTADIPMHNIIPETTTRGSIQTEDQFYSNFGIFGYFYDSTQSWASVNSISPEPSMTNLLVTQNDNSWTTDVYWPGGTKKATFFAYAPHNCQGATLTSDTGTPKITYTVPSVIDEQQDILIAKSDEDISCDGKSDVDLTFKHALTAIKFTQGELGDYTKITSITISGVNNKGELSLDGASWDNVSATSGNSYTISSQDGITLNDVILLLMPQTLPSGAKLEVTMTNDIGTKTFSTTLTGVWQKGYTVTYQLSVNKIFGDYVLEITPNKPTIGENGGDVSMTVRSYFEYSDGSSQISLPWTASYAYADGTDTRTPIANALTITSASSGNGGSIGESINANIGKQYFKSNKTLSASEKGTESEPFDLSTYNPATGETLSGEDRRSANCYVVNAPGWYKIPLYYGNSLNNTAGYGTATFQNHEGTQINNQNRNFSSKVTSGKLLWQDEYALITPTSISKTSDGQYLKFYVSPDAIAQGNAVIAALNSNDQILWSWHIWVTDLPLTERVNVLSGANRNTDYKFMTMPVGFCEASTLSYPQRDFIVTIKQGTSCKLAAAKISQKSEITQYVGENCTFYQWGRKDPFPGSNGIKVNTDNYLGNQKLCYDANGDDFEYKKQGGNTDEGSGKQSMAGSILNPTTFYYSKTTGDGESDWYDPKNDWCSTTYNDNWSMIDASINGNWADDNITKTVYDPCPIGFKMPGCNAFTRFTTTGNNTSTLIQFNVSSTTSYASDEGWWFCTQADQSGTTDFWRAFGFIDCYAGRYTQGTGNGCLAYAGFDGYYWSARASSAGRGCILYFNSGYVSPRTANVRAFGFAARPVSE